MQRALFLLTFALLVGCGRAPSPLNPAIHGSIGTTSKGMLRGGVTVANHGHVRWLRNDDRHFAIPRFARAIERAAASVAAQRPSSTLTIGDLSVRHGGHLTRHASHASGRDADLLLYLTTLEGVPITSPGFISVRPDGLAWDPARGEFVRFDVEREWLLVRALLEDEDARVQWMFVHETLEAILIEYALARGDPAEIIRRAQEVMLQSGGPHDDHIHVRTECSYEDIVAGCEPTGPRRDWMKDVVPPVESSEALALEIARPFRELGRTESARR